MFSPSASSGARIAWRDKQKGLDPQRLGCIGETWASANMTPRYGRCERGKRLLAYAPFDPWKTTPFLAALRHDRSTAPRVFDGPINGARFLAYAAQVRVPALSPGDIVVMDNPGSHKVAGVGKAIEAAGATQGFLPAYSPDLDPIEQAFANSPPAFPPSCACSNLKPASRKNRLRKMARRTVDALWDGSGLALDGFPPSECFNYFRNAGNGST